MSDMIKVHIKLNGEECGVGGETLWAEQKTHNTAEIMNIPFFADGISLGDVIKFKEVDGIYEIVGMKEKRSHHILVRYETSGDMRKKYTKLAKHLESNKIRIESAAPGMASIAYPISMTDNDLVAILDKAPHLVEYGMD